MAAIWSGISYIIFNWYGKWELLANNMEFEQNLYGQDSLSINFRDCWTCMYMSRSYQDYGWINVKGDSIARKLEMFFLMIKKQ